MHEVLFLMLCSIVLMPKAHAAMADTASWRYNITPYLWNVSFDGEVSSQGDDFLVDEDYSFFTLDNLDNVLALKFEARKDRLAFLFDGLRARYSDAVSGPLLTKRLAVELGYLEGAVGYAPWKSRNLQVLAGIRYLYLDTNLGIDSIRNVEESNDWLDPLIGLRYGNLLVSDWYYELRGDVAGFGGSTDSTVNVQAMLSYRRGETLSAEIGYRYMDIEFSEDDFSYNVTMQGLFIGLGIWF
jgi:hypothetical protein